MNARDGCIIGGQSMILWSNGLPKPYPKVSGTRWYTVGSWYLAYVHYVFAFAVVRRLYLGSNIG